MLAGRILVVDDEPMICEALKRMLAADAHQVETAVDAQEALAKFKPKWFHLVIVDYQMPGIRGNEVARALKALAPGQPVAILTGDGAALESAGAASLGVDAIMSKPFSLEEIRQTLNRLLKKQRRSTPATGTIAPEARPAASGRPVSQETTLVARFPLPSR